MNSKQTKKDIRVTIVTSDEAHRKELVLLINSTFGMQVVNACNHAENLIHLLMVDQPDVVLLATGSLGKKAIETAWAKYLDNIKQGCTYAKILVLASTACKDFILDNLKAGADGFITRDIHPAKLLEAIQLLHEGGAPLSPAVARAVISSFHKNTQSVLTLREVQVLKLMATGKPYSAIAVGLSIEKETVRTHIKNIYLKLEVHSKSAAIQKASSERII